MSGRERGRGGAASALGKRTSDHLTPPAYVRERLLGHPDQGFIGNRLGRTGGFWIQVDQTIQLELFDALQVDLPGQRIRFLMPSEEAERFGPPCFHDMKTCVALTTLWADLPRLLRPDARVGWTLSEISRMLGGKTHPSGEQLDRVWASLNRLALMAIESPGVDEHGKPTRVITRIIQEASFTRGRLGSGRRERGRLGREESGWIVFSEHYLREIAWLNWTYALDRVALNALPPLAARLYIFLAALPQGRGTVRGGRTEIRIPCNPAFYENLGLRGGRPQEKRAAINAAARRLMELEPIYASLGCQLRRRGEWFFEGTRENVPSRAAERRSIMRRTSIAPLADRTTAPPRPQGTGSPRLRLLPTPHIDPDLSRRFFAIGRAVLGLTDPDRHRELSAYHQAFAIWMAEPIGEPPTAPTWFEDPG